MDTTIAFRSIFGIFLATFTPETNAQSLPGSLSFTVSGSFFNGVGESSRSVLIADNNPTNGYAFGMDLHDAPASLNPSGSTGSAAFQWGEPKSNSDYAHSSALWFQPLSAANVAPEQYFNLGYLYFRNGTITTNTGASSVDLALSLNFSNPSGISPLSTFFTSDLINSVNGVNGKDPVASADIVSLRNQESILNFNDVSGNNYYLELTFKVDQDTLDGTLSTIEQFKVFEGSQGRAELLGRFTTTQMSSPIPEPSSALMAVISVLPLIRRKR
jgi:hypothetical protein